MKKRKPWRKYKKHYITKGHVRWLCLLLLALETFVLCKKGVISVPAIEVKKDSQTLIYQIQEEEEAEGRASRSWGIRIRTKEGTLEFYENRNQEAPLSP